MVTYDVRDIIQFMNTNVKDRHMLERKVEAIFHKIDQKLEMDYMKKKQET